MLNKRESIPGAKNGAKPEAVSLKKLKETKINPLTKIPFSQRYFKLLEDRSKLPAFEAKEHLLQLLDDEDVVIIQGETGSGKTTQIPQFIMNSKWSQGGKLIAVTQPRRIAAISVAKRVAEESDTILGEQVGYNIRFEDCTSAHTKLKYLTDGMLIRELVSDKYLSKYSIIMLDEAHERTLNTDILLAILKNLVNLRNGKANVGNSHEVRKGKSDNSGNIAEHHHSNETLLNAGPLKLVIMSATIEIDRFVNYFNKQAPVLTIPGRQYPVEIYYSAKPEEDYLNAAVRTSVQIHVNEGPGDILIFLTGEEEIEKAVNRISLELGSYETEVDPFVVLPLYGSMSTDSQQKVFDRTPGYRKIVISTNIAETSVTIDGIVFVVDCGLSKQKVYNPRMKYESLLVAPISQASAKQRAGRAGRTAPGKCFRLFTERSYDLELKSYSIPEILRSELSSTILNLKLLGVENIVKFDFMEAPAPETVFRGLEILVHIGAIDPEKGFLTPEGRSLGLFPLEPRYGKVLLKAKELGIVEEVLNSVAVLTTGSWRIRPPEESRKADDMHKRFVDESNCDLLTMHNVMKAFEASKRSKEFTNQNYLNHRVLSAAINVKTQLKQILYTAKTNLENNQAFSSLKSSERLKIAYLSGFYLQIAHLQRNGTYCVFNESHLVLIHPSSAVKNKPDFVLYLEFVLTSKNYIRTVSEINPQWLIQLYPDVFDPSKLKNIETRRALESAAKSIINLKK
jgi:pre-mRNA-splicing factor ATP-dependent RNA helicase DHX15/PRP43